MQGFNFGIRNSATPSVDDTQSRYVPSSIYSGPGPAEESPLPPHPIQQYYQNDNGRLSQASAYQHYEQRYLNRPTQPRASTALNTNDPVTMHLLMETAIMDSKDFEILSFEELELLKKERGVLRTKLEGAKRQLGLEKKMLDAAQLMGRLAPSEQTNQKRSSFFGRRSSSGGVVSANAELDSSVQKVEQLTQEVKTLEARLQDTESRIMHHTAGILQFTHRGLKKNIRKNELPRSPESMASHSRSIDCGSDFDERSLYQVPDYVHDFMQSHRASRRITREVQPIEDVAIRLHTINNQLHGMIQQAPLTEHFEAPPEPTDEGLQGRVGAQIQAHLTYMAQGLEALAAAQENMPRGGPSSETTEQIGQLTTTLHGMLERTNSVSKSPILAQDLEDGNDLQSQLAYSATILERLDQRVETLLEQKDILTRQIQQQRELNNKSDAQKDAQIRDLLEEADEAGKLQDMSEQEMAQAQNQISLLMEQLDQAKTNEQLLEKQAGMQDSKALEAERAARKASETKLMQEIEMRQHALTELQADHSRIQNDFERKLQNHIRQLEEVNAAKEQAELSLDQQDQELNALRDEMQRLESQVAQTHTGQLEETNAAKSQAEAQKLNQQLSETITAKEAAEHQLSLKTTELTTLRAELQTLESQVIQFSTELTMAKAELDAAYGTRAQRAADVSMNPSIKKQIDLLTAKNAELERELKTLNEAHETKGAGSAELQNKVNSLQKELKDTIEDYELMTKASIEFERERERLEGLVEELRERCEGLEGRIQEDQVKWLGLRDGGKVPPETTSVVVLKGEFKRMMRESRAEGVRALKAEQEERKRLELMLRDLRKQVGLDTHSKVKSPHAPTTSTNGVNAIAAPSTPSKE